jgi:hypothetical protein
VRILAFGERETLQKTKGALSSAPNPVILRRTLFVRRWIWASRAKGGLQHARLWRDGVLDAARPFAPRAFGSQPYQNFLANERRRALWRALYRSFIFSYSLFLE